MANVEAALSRFMQSSADTRQRLSEATWAELQAFKAAHPEVTLDDIIALHNEFLEEYDAMAAPLTNMQKKVKDGHRATIDLALDARNEQRKQK